MSGRAIGAGRLLRIIKLEPGFELWHLAKQYPRDYPFLMESVITGTEQSRYSILCAYPSERLIQRADGSFFGTGHGDLIPGPQEQSFLRKFDAWWSAQRQPDLPASASVSLPFTGGWFVFVSYELLHEIEPTVEISAPHTAIPLACAYRIGVVLIHDRLQDEKWLVLEPGYEDREKDIQQQIQTIRAHKTESRTPQAVSGIGQTGKPLVFPTDLIEEESARYIDNIGRIKNYVYEGDVFQVNISRLWHGRLAPSVRYGDVYDNLRRSNPAPFCAFAHFGDAAIISSSPERLFEIRADVIQTRPIAGTYPRHVNLDRDEALSRELLTHPKERAEHIMLIDMERNDLGRICEGGSVEVNELMATESYTHVHHIVSNVRGRVRKNCSPGQILSAMFPGGTITGCPKVRCMQIIHELEKSRRGAYTGSLGYIGHNGDSDFNILIRTICCDKSNIELRAGGGIVIDSDPQRELAETRHKARGPAQALHGLLAP